METLKAIAARTSIRSYRAQQIEPDKLATILSAGQNAPNAGPFQLSVIQDPAVLRQLSEAARTGMQRSGDKFLMERVALPGYDPIYGAPTVILISAPAGNRYSSVNAALAAENMILAATDLGLGSCYLVSPGLAFTGKESGTIAAKTALPQGYAFQCAVAIGYTAGEAFATSTKQKGTVVYIR